MNHLLLNSLDVGLAVLKRQKDTLYIFNKMSEISKEGLGLFNYHLRNKLIKFDGSISKIYSARLLGLEGDYNLYKLHITKKRHKNNIRTFWLAEVGYKKYVLTNIFPIKDHPVEVLSIIHDDKRKILYVKSTPNGFFNLFINNYSCVRERFIKSSHICADCNKFYYCSKLYEKHSLNYIKVYMYFIKNHKRVYL